MAEDDSTSKKPFAANWLSKLPNPPVFFVDRSLGRHKFAGALREAGMHVEVHDDLFPGNAPDEMWLSAAGQNGWVVLTKDKNIRYHRREKEALVAHGVRAFVLTPKDVTADEMAEMCIRALPKISRALRKNKGAFVATIGRAGAVQVVWPTAKKADKSAKS
jgi:predicted nuclease of predicted toxin-antitoxin system